MMREFWAKLTSRRYETTLEAEVARLRAENRALLNSILGIAGVPPISVAMDGESKPVGHSGEGNDSYRALRKPAIKQGPQGIQAGAPMRRRSWLQINRALEFESAKKNEQGDGVALPTARKE
jgi:hypothetical protein